MNSAPDRPSAPVSRRLSVRMYILLVCLAAGLPLILGDVYTFIHRSASQVVIDDVVVVGLAMAVALLLSFAIGRRITRPLRRLVRASHLLAEAPADAVVAPGDPAEVAELTASFNAMAARLRKRQRWDEALKTIGQFATSRRSLPEILEGGLAAIMQAADATLGLVRLVDPATRELVIAAHRNVPPDHLEAHRRIPWGTDLAGHVAQAGGQTLFESLSAQPADSHFRTLLGGVESIVCLALIDQGHVVGTLTLGHPLPHSFDPGDVEQLRPAASFFSGAILAEQLRAATQQDAAEKALLLRELNHRVRNNLAALIGLLSLAEEQVEGPAAERLRDMGDRVQRLAEIHDLLAGRWHQFIQVREVAELVAKNVLEALPAGAPTWQVTGDAVSVASAQVTPLAMVLNELLTNIVKHAFDGRPDGRVEISILARGDDIEVVVADNGRGGQLDPGRRGLGSRIVELLVTKTLGGRLSVETDGGRRVSLRFPHRREPEARP